jgi:hypothetical protein
MEHQGLGSGRIVVAVGVLVLAVLACGGGSGGPAGSGDEASEQGEDPGVPLSDEAIGELITEELEALYQEFMTGLFLLSTPFSTGNTEAVDGLFSNLQGFATQSELAAMKQHASKLYSHIVFVAGDETGDLRTCLTNVASPDDVSYIDTKLLVGGVQWDGNIGISSLSAFDADEMGTSAQSYVLDNGLHHLIRLSFFDPEHPGLAEVAQWQYEMTGEFFSVNLKNVLLNSHEEFLTFNGVSNGQEWASESTHLQSYFDMGIWQMQFNPSMFDADTLFSFSSNNLDTNNQDDPDAECLTDHALLDESGLAALPMAPFILALEERKADLAEYFVQDGLQLELRYELPAKVFSEEGIHISGGAELGDPLRAILDAELPAGYVGAVYTDQSYNDWVEDFVADIQVNMEAVHGIIRDPAGDQLACSGVPAPDSFPFIDIGTVILGTTMDNTILVASIELLNSGFGTSLEEFMTSGGHNFGAGLEIYNPGEEAGGGLLLSNQYEYSYIQDGSRFDVHTEYLDGEWSSILIEPESEVPSLDEVFFVMEERILTIFVPGMLLEDGAQIYISSTNNGSGADCFGDIVDPQIEIERDEFVDPQDYRFTVGFRF